jgi:hypothetical protein
MEHSVETVKPFPKTSIRVLLKGRGSLGEKDPKTRGFVKRFETVEPELEPCMLSGDSPMGLSALMVMETGAAAEAESSTEMQLCWSLI